MGNTFGKDKNRRTTNTRVRRVFVVPLSSSERIIKGDRRRISPKEERRRRGWSGGEAEDDAAVLLTERAGRGLGEAEVYADGGRAAEQLAADAQLLQVDAPARLAVGVVAGDEQDLGPAVPRGYVARVSGEDAAVAAVLGAGVAHGLHDRSLDVRLARSAQQNLLVPQGGSEALRIQFQVQHGASPLS